MVNDCKSVWDNCLQTIRENVSPQSFRTWFEPIKPVKLHQKTLTIQVPNKFFYEYLDEQYWKLLKQTVTQELGDKARLEYLFSVQQNHPQSSVSGDAASANTIQDPDFVNSDVIKNPFVIPGIKKAKVEPQLNPNYTFERYIEGDCNRLCRSAGLAVAKKPGKTAFNPLVIYGSVGLGKTHLAHAIGNEVIQAFPDKNVVYISSEKFTNQIIEAIKNHAVNDFLNFYHQMDVLIVDDIQFLANKIKTQELFFQVFNQLHQSGRQLILTSDRAPKDLEGMEERLLSRFKWGLTADLQTPDLETRMAILQSKLEEAGLEIPFEVAEFISFNIKDNIRELEGVVISLIAQASLNRRKIDMPLAKEVVQKFVAQVQREITLESIQSLVAEHFDIPVEKLEAPTRKRNIVIARQLCMYLGKHLTNKSLKHIGDMFGGRDHSTVIYSLRAVRDMMDTDLSFKGTVEALEKRARMSIMSL